jgi:hypothetical protein
MAAAVVQAGQSRQRSLAGVAAAGLAVRGVLDRLPVEQAAFRLRRPTVSHLRELPGRLLWRPRTTLKMAVRAAQARPILRSPVPRADHRFAAAAAAGLVAATRQPRRLSQVAKAASPVPIRQVVAAQSVRMAHRPRQVAQAAQRIPMLADQVAAAAERLSQPQPMALMAVPVAMAAAAVVVVGSA